LLTGILIGAIMTFVASIVGEVRVARERNNQAELLETIAIKDEAIEEKNVRIQELRKGMRELISASIELTHDYTIIAKVLEEEIGKEESYNRYIEKKNEKPRDLNELLRERKGEKNE
jgi:hypothetical protein